MTAARSLRKTKMRKRSRAAKSTQRNANTPRSVNLLLNSPRSSRNPKSKPKRKLKEDEEIAKYLEHKKSSKNFRWKQAEALQKLVNRQKQERKEKA